MFRYQFTRFIFQIIRRLLLVKIRVHGRENIPAQGPYIVTVNHMSSTDTPVLSLSFPTQHWRFFAGESWQEHRIFGPLMAWHGAIYIKRGQADRQALREAMKALEEGSVFGLAPEGTRSKVGSMRQAKAGAAYLASRGQVPIIPVGITGTENLFANAQSLKFTQVEVFIGEPYELPDIGRRARSPDFEAYTQLIMVKIADLLPEKYHGVYADHPGLQALQAGEDPWPYCQLVERN